MKLDTGKAWSDAVALISSNRDAVLAVAGLFFFLPQFALFLLMPEAIGQQQVTVPDGSSPDVMMDALQAQFASQFANFWWVSVLLAVAQWFGMLSLMALMIDQGRPTVRESMGIGGRGLLPYVLAQILVVIGLSLAIGIPLGLLAALGSGVILGIAVLVAIPFMIYVFVKVTLLPAIIAIEGTANPVSAIKRSWSLTKGNSFALFLFLFLLTIAAMIIALLVTLLMTTILAVVGGSVQTIALGFLESAVSAVIAVVLLAAIGAVYQQLAGPGAAEVSETFE